MNFYYFQTLRKYTSALLDLFSDIRIQKTNEDGEVIKEFSVPIEFGSKQKAYIINNIDIEKLKTGNVNFLPRMSLTILGISRAPERNTGKIKRINENLKDNFNIQYQNNANPYDFKFQLSIATKELNEMAMIIEQIIPFFNPSYTLLIKEIDNQNYFTSVPVVLDDVNLEVSDEINDDYDIIIHKCDLSLIVKGNIYPPIKTQEKINKYILNFGIPNIMNEQELPNGKLELIDSLGNKLTIISEKKIDIETGLFFNNITSIYEVKKENGVLRTTKLNNGNMIFEINGIRIEYNKKTKEFLIDGIYIEEEVLKNIFKDCDLREKEFDSYTIKSDENFYYIIYINKEIKISKESICSLKNYFTLDDLDIFSHPLNNISINFGDFSKSEKIIEKDCL